VPEKTEQFRIALAQAVDFAKVLKPKAINVLPGCCFDQQRLVAYQNTFLDNLSLALTHFSELGINTVFEAINTYDMPSFLVHSGAQMLQILEVINHPNLLMQYDIYHMHRMGEDIAGFIHDYARKMGHIQIADYPGRGQPGSGEIDFNTLFLEIEQSGYQSWVGAEYKPQGLTENGLTWLK